MHRGYPTYLITLSLLVIPCIAVAQQWKADLIDHFNFIRSGEHSSIPEVDKSADVYKLLHFLTQFSADSSYEVQIATCEIVHRYAIRSQDPDVRMVAVDILAEVFANGDGVAKASASAYLKTFRYSDFGKGARENIKGALTSDNLYLGVAIRLSGFLQIREVTSTLQSLSQPGNAPAIRWSAILSLARLGELDAIDEIMGRVRRAQINDDITYHLFPDLIFTRTREAMSFLVEVLNSDDPACLAADVEREKSIPCAYRIMEQLAPVIEEFPLPLDGSGDVLTEDYRDALITVRRWFRENPNYKVRSDTY